MEAGKRVSQPVQEAFVSKPGNMNRNHNFPDTSLEGLPPDTVDL